MSNLKRPLPKCIHTGWFKKYISSILPYSFVSIQIISQYKVPSKYVTYDYAYYDVCICICMHACMYGCMGVWMYACMHVCVCVCKVMYCNVMQCNAM